MLLATDESCSNRTPAVQLLVHKGANILAKDTCRHWTPKEWADAEAHAATAKTLIAAARRKWCQEDVIQRGLKLHLERRGLDARRLK